MTFGGALGLWRHLGAACTPACRPQALAVLAGLYAALIHVASFAAGGYLAGRLRTPWVTTDTVESHFRDGGHGFRGVGAGRRAGRGARAVGRERAAVKTAIGATTAVASAGAAGAAANPQTPGALQQLSTAADRLRRRPPAGARDSAPQPPAAGGPAAGLARRPRRADRARLRRQHQQPAARRARSHLRLQPGQPAHRPAAGQAEKRVDEAFAELKAAEQKARDAADKARKATPIAGFLAAATMAIGCAPRLRRCALGARHRDDRTLVALFG